MVRTLRRSVPNGKRGLPLKVLYNLWSDFPQKFGASFNCIFNTSEDWYLHFLRTHNIYGPINCTLGHFTGIWQDVGLTHWVICSQTAAQGLGSCQSNHKQRIFLCRHRGLRVSVRSGLEPWPGTLGTFTSEDEDDYKYEFSVLNMRITFVGRHFSKCTCSEQKTRTRSRPRPPI